MADFKPSYGYSSYGYGDYYKPGERITPDKGRFDDWYWYTGRSEKSGYTTGSRSRLGWESEIRGTGKSYSSVFWRPTVTKDKAELISRAYNLAKDMILVMDTPTRVGIKILAESSDAAFTDGKVVFVSTDVFDDSKITESEAVDIFCGFTIHEGCHLLYTEMKPFERWVREHENSGTEDLNFRKNVFNILEDERVESKLSENKPGLTVFLEKMKDYYLNSAEKGYSGDIITKEEDSLSDEERAIKKYEKTIEVLFRIIRYPKGLTQEDLEVNQNFFNRVQDYIIPLPETTEKTLEATDKICDLMIQTLLEDGLGLPEKELKRRVDSLANPDKRPSSLSGKRLKNFLSGLMGSELLCGVDMDRISDALSCGETSGKVSAAVSQNKGVLGRILEGTYEYGESNETIFVKHERDWGNEYERSNYLKEKKEIQAFIPSIKKILMSNNKNYSGVLHGCKTGTLDTTKLAEAYQGVEHVYFKNYQVKTKQTSVCIVIDESGSMGGSREVSARKAAILMNEAFKDLPGVNLYIYGQSADQLKIYSDKSTDIYVYKEPGMKRRDFLLANSHARWENRDGVALREIAKRIRKRDQNEVLMFILSDGEPSAVGYRGFVGMEDTKKAGLELEKMGILPIQVSISSWYDPTKLFKNTVILSDLSTLAQELGKVVKKAVLKAGQQEMIL